MNTILFVGTMTAQQPLATCSLGLNERENPTGKQATPVPSALTEMGQRLMFPASGLRGALRRSARDVIRKHVIKQSNNDNPFTLEQHYFLSQGGIKGAGEQARSSIVDLESWLAANPLLSLFGAGDAGFLGFVQGKSSIGNAICNDPVEPTVFSGTRVDELYRHPEQINYLSKEDVDRLVQQAMGGKQRSIIQKNIKTVERERNAARRNSDSELADKLNEDVAALKEELEAVKADTGAQDVSVGMPLSGFKAIPMGSTMAHTMRISRSSEVDLGLLLESLNAFSLNPILGAHSAVGCGEVSGKWDVFSVNLDDRVGKKRLGSISMGGFEPLTIEGDELVKAVASFNAFMDTDQWNFSIPTKDGLHVNDAKA